MGPVLSASKFNPGNVLAFSCLPFFASFTTITYRGTDQYFDDTSLELVLNYKFIRKDMLEAYAGIGGRVQIFEGLVILLGMNIYPFENKRFGFQMEIAGLFN